MASKLKAIDPKKAEPSRPKILLFGKPGVGKTWGSLEFPKVFLIDTEGGADRSHYTDRLVKAGGVYLGPDQGSLSFDTIIEQIQALGTEKHTYQTVVIDSITKLFNLAVAAEAERLGAKNVFGADRKPAIANMRRLVNWLSRIDMNVILIAHEKADWGQGANGERVEVGTTFDCWPTLEYELDLCLNIIKQGNSRIARVKKSRLLEFPDASTFPWSYAEFAKLYGEKSIEKAVTQIVLASPEQLAELHKLLSVIKLPEGQEDKWLKAAQVDDWSEMASERIDKAIQHIRKTYMSAEK